MFFALLLAFAFNVNAAGPGAGYDVLEEGKLTQARLEHCGGWATLQQTYVGGKRLPLLVISGSTNCSRIDIDGRAEGKLEQGRAEVVIHERAGLNVHVVSIYSKSGKTSDTVKVVSFGQGHGHGGHHKPNPQANIVFEFGWASAILGNAKWARLNDCGGLVEAAVENSQVNLKFSGVNSCSKFDILGANGESVNYPTKSLQRARTGEFAGSFTIPRKYIDAGNNAVKVILKSNTGKTDEVILIRFKAF